MSDPSPLPPLTADELTDVWLRCFGVLPGDKVDSDRWSRVHWLPGGEQYPRHRGQRAVALQRLNAVLDHVLGLDEPYVLVVTDLGSADVAVPARVDPRDFLPLRTTLEEGFLPRELRFRQLRWRSGSQDALLWQVMDDDLPGLKFFSAERGCLAVPYPGGIDVLTRTDEDARAFRETFAAWASFVGEVDAFEVVRAAHPDERATLHDLVSAGASVSLDDDDRAHELRICSSRVDDAIAERIARLEALAYLHISPWARDAAPSRLTGRGLAHLQRLTRLVHLSLPGEDAESFPLLTEDLPLLRALQRRSPGLGA